MIYDELYLHLLKTVPTNRQEKNEFKGAGSQSHKVKKR